jgi:hypothetical protein
VDDLPDQLAEINRKLDHILERLKWAPESCASWFEAQKADAKEELRLPLDFK